MTGIAHSSPLLLSLSLASAFSASNLTGSPRGQWIFPFCIQLVGAVEKQPKKQMKLMAISHPEWMRILKQVVKQRETLPNSLIYWDEPRPCCSSSLSGLCTKPCWWTFQFLEREREREDYPNILKLQQQSCFTGKSET